MGAFPEQGEDFVKEIVEANQRHLSWRNRLGWILGLFADSSFELNTEHLIYIAIYLRFIATGEVPCKEEGGHYRPSHHARTSQQIYERLAEITTPENVFVIRKIFPWLPSFDSTFTRAEPLTRIRDIAHRNDIPGELKNEIKHTLQNKLHRSAGPEDLFTSECLLKRITSPGSPYPSSFVEEFKRFHEELREFFNAGSLEERLAALAVGAEKDEASSIRKFLEAKSRIDTPEQMLTAFGLLTGLRHQLCNMAERESATGQVSARSQQLQMADIGLEDFSFVLLSCLNNCFGAPGEEIQWKPAFFSLEQAIADLRFSGFDAEECLAIEAELNNWSRWFSRMDPENLLRLRATLDRCSRLAGDYCNKILSLFPERAEKLGLALGVDIRAIKVFSESDIRSHPVFQVSKLVALILKRVRALANISLWDIIVTGNACGRVVAAHGIGDLPDAAGGPVIALLDKAEGDEEIPGNVAGIIVAHEIPHLSHLAVRARQNHVVFIAYESREGFDGLKALVNHMVNMDVAGERVSLKIVPDHGDKRRDATSEQVGVKVIKLSEVMLPSRDKLLLLLPLSNAVPETSGGKAGAARQLEVLSGLESAGFRTAPGLVVPFGVMEASLSAQPALEEEYRKLVRSLSEIRQNEFAGVLTRLREIISHLPVQDEIVSGIAGEFAVDDRLMVRSSSNCEDMKNLSGAGLYDSVANVLPSDAAQAIRKVWASLWTKRAVMSRENCGISHETALMAVLIQKVIVPELSFILHTDNPVDDNPEEVYMELAVGMGETLASAGAPGFPFRIVYNKKTGEVHTLAFASFSRAAWPSPSGGLVMKTVDYSAIRLSKDKSYRDLIGQRLGRAGQFVELAFHAPQDIEGVISGDEIFFVQSRAQRMSSDTGAFSKKD
ncbi:MAG: hypothetical protein HQL08_04775 [Nitrospirae bacterium]|nr:hypothetical protein [Nitrospirota bacterium]